MPVNLKIPFLGDFVVTGSRGEVVKKMRSKQPKDDPAYVNADPDIKAPTKPDTLMPRINLERATAFTRFATSKSIERQIDQLTPLKSPDEIARAVLNHVAANLPPRGTATKPILILVGEHHDSRASLMTNMAVLAAATREGRKPIVLMEFRPSDVSTIHGVSREIRRDLATAATMGADRSLFVKDMLNKPYLANEPGAPTHWAILYGLAHDAGGRVGGFDLAPEEGPTVVQREAEMTRAIQGALNHSGGEPVIVVTGGYHVAPLHHVLEGETHMIALATVGEPNADQADTPHERKQLSYVHANGDKILRLRPSPELVAGSFDFDAFADSLSMARGGPPTVVAHVGTSASAPPGGGVSGN